MAECPCCGARLGRRYFDGASDEKAKGARWLAPRRPVELLVVRENTYNVSKPWFVKSDGSSSEEFTVEFVGRNGRTARTEFMFLHWRSLTPPSLSKDTGLLYRNISMDEEFDRKKAMVLFDVVQATFVDRLRLRGVSCADFDLAYEADVSEIEYMSGVNWTLKLVHIIIERDLELSGPLCIEPSSAIK